MTSIELTYTAPSMLVIIYQIWSDKRIMIFFNNFINKKRDDRWKLLRSGGCSVTDWKKRNNRWKLIRRDGCSVINSKQNATTGECWLVEMAAGL